MIQLKKNWLLSVFSTHICVNDTFQLLDDIINVFSGLSLYPRLTSEVGAPCVYGQIEPVIIYNVVERLIDVCVSG